MSIILIELLIDNIMKLYLGNKFSIQILLLISFFPFSSLEPIKIFLMNFIFLLFPLSDIIVKNNILYPTSSNERNNCSLIRYIKFKIVIKLGIIAH